MIKLEKQAGGGEDVWAIIELVKAELGGKDLLSFHYEIDLATHPYSWRADVRMNDGDVASYWGELPDSTPQYRGPLLF